LSTWISVEAYFAVSHKILIEKLLMYRLDEQRAIGLKTGRVAGPKK